MSLIIRFKSPDYSSQKGKRFTKQNEKKLFSLNHKIFRYASKLLQSHWPRRYFLSLHMSKQKIICKSILSWPVGFEKKNWSSCLMCIIYSYSFQVVLGFFLFISNSINIRIMTEEKRCTMPAMKWNQSSIDNAAAQKETEFMKKKYRVMKEYDRAREKKVGRSWGSHQMGIMSETER